MVWWSILLRKYHSMALMQFDSKQCREQFVTVINFALSLVTQSRFPQSRCNSLAFRTPVLLRLLLDLDTYG